MKHKKKLFLSTFSIIIFAVGMLIWSPADSDAAGGKVTSSTGTAPDRYVYYPGTEELGKDEIRLFACGTGMPAARRDQAATCWLVECGNGDKFMFDVGTGSMVNVAAMMIPYDMLNKVFLTHLHTDHWVTWPPSGPAVGPRGAQVLSKSGDRAGPHRKWAPNTLWSIF